MRTSLVVAGLLALAGLAPGSAATHQQEPPSDSPATAFGETAAIESTSEWVWADAGSRLQREPDPRSGVLALVDVRTELAVLDHHEDWVRVRYGNLSGWIATLDEAGESSGGRSPSSRAVPAAGWSARYVARAREVFGLEASAELFGDFALYTDVVDPELLELLRRTSEKLPSAYQARYGLEGEPSARESILLFAREADYRAFTLEDVAKRRPDLRGHATPEVAVLYAGGNPPHAVAAVLIHELTHILSRRVFETSIPPWLEEGLANDLAFCRIDENGRVQLGSLLGRSVVIEQPEYDEGGFIRLDRGVQLTGPLASLRLVQEHWGSPDTPSLALLTDLVWSEFTEAIGRELRYASSAFLIRYLLDSSDPNLAAGFRSFLGAIADGAPAGPEELAHRVSGHEDRELEDVQSGLEAGFSSWIAAQRLAG